jgi:hypothetical protein
MVQKCEHCKLKKVNTLLAFSCRCGFKYLCDKCRYPEDHKCTHDFKKEASERLKKENEKVVADKVEKI